jgi:hypothetical protein
MPELVEPEQVYQQVENTSNPLGKVRPITFLHTDTENFTNGDDRFPHSP